MLISDERCKEIAEGGGFSPAEIEAFMQRLHANFTRDQLLALAALINDFPGLIVEAIVRKAGPPRQEPAKFQEDLTILFPI